MRKPVIAANWKMYKTVSESREFVKKVVPACESFTGVEVILCPTFLSLANMVEDLKNTSIKLGAQDLFWEKEGAYTGEVSPYLLSDLGVSYVIVGHSERRGYFGETDSQVNDKVKAAFSFNIKPIFCIGESLEQREEGITKKVIERQLEQGLLGVDSSSAADLTIAYEPIWAIGTGRSASVEDAREVIAFIRQWVFDNFSPEIAQNIPILYGGSVNPDNLEDLLAQEEIDGALIGGASLKEDSFIKMVTAANNF
ncbi:triose-phosphate isomerase [Candidatus Contubernalis alkaliaceticus]|uniref:triose-phosphate isomerase n=1 Tax=Candidatus Contubernalis alkaliaceticus TaxID=338645 RepID=UPI001F4C1940|nr:triose-phosphate isomerase [Candidatus Contubernalis alkalaceticus]UNC90792.1 triose-phosphate isomerase [Candidatus Contubernalis alkalaceticus]